MDNFEKIFDGLTKQYDPNRIFDEFLDYCIDINLFTTINQNLNFEGREKYYFEMFKEWINITNENLTGNGWYDYLGKFYENIVQTKYKAGVNGQFFTPADVCQLMVDVTIEPEKDYSNTFVNDCCCGSGRFLLASHNRLPDSIMIGSDLDIVACKMSVLNFYIHGVKGSILHQNTLTGETFACWKVNNYLGYGLPLPHIQLCNESEVYDFFGVKQADKKVELQDEIPKTVFGYSDNTVQTRLM